VVKVYYDRDVTTNYLKNKTVAVIGYGSQGRAQSQNLRDSGLDVIVSDLPGSLQWKTAEKEGFRVFKASEAAERAEVVQMLTQDMVQPLVYEEIKPHLTEGKALGFSHGFNIHFQLIVPPPHIDVFMVAPKGPGPTVRGLYLEGFGSPALLAVYQDYTGKGETVGLEYAKALGCTRAGVLKTTFKDETESDLIGEQTVLVGGLVELLKKGFEVLVEEGYPPELAYFEACNEAKLIVDIIYRKGILGMLHAVSETARYGGLAVGPKVVDEHVKENMRKAARDVKEGIFARQWIEEARSGRENLQRMLKEMEDHPIEKVGRFIRKMSGLEESE